MEDRLKILYVNLFFLQLAHPINVARSCINITSVCQKWLYITRCGTATTGGQVYSSQEMEWSEFLEPRITDRDSKINGRQEIFDCSLAFRKLQRYFCLQDKYIKSFSASRGGTPLYKLYRWGPPSGRIFAPFWSENGYTLRPFWSGIGYGFRGSYGLYERIVAIPNFSL